MNLLLFASEGDLRHIKPGDPRLPHVREVLRMRTGDRLYAGVLGGRRAWATILRDDPAEGMFTEPAWEPQEPPRPLPLRVLVGLPRPQTARRILFEAAVFGVTSLDFFQAQKGEPSYAQSSLWHSAEWSERLWQGAEQACVTDLPQVRHFANLEDALCAPDAYNANKLQAAHSMSEASEPRTPGHAEAMGGANATCADATCADTTTADAAPPVAPIRNVRLALDVYEAVAPLSHLLPTGTAPGRLLTLAIGAERGWSPQERTQLAEHDFLLTHIGQRVLRAETAFVSALSLAADKLLHPEI